ncbi:hypothetical protein HHI36_017427 [Cryptolaemus montrouzieri]|uniref:Uncharacterized protein n=1 Tax=Cryptolaemus montrouzieri TaxID=559131 RepID=A0ABD2NNN9_9CUCU
MEAQGQPEEDSSNVHRPQEEETPGNTKGNHYRRTTNRMEEGSKISRRNSGRPSVLQDAHRGNYKENKCNTRKTIPPTKRKKQPRNNLRRTNLASRGQIREEETTSSTQQDHQDSNASWYISNEQLRKETEIDTLEEIITTNNKGNRPDGRPRKQGDQPNNGTTTEDNRKEDIPSTMEEETTGQHRCTTT